MEELLRCLSMEELLETLTIEELPQGLAREELLRASTETCNGETFANVSVLVLSRDFQLENLHNSQVTRGGLIRG